MAKSLLNSNCVLIKTSKEFPPAPSLNLLSLFQHIEVNTLMSTYNWDVNNFVALERFSYRL